MVLYFTNGSDWELMVDTQQEINFKIIEIVKTRSDFAFLLDQYSLKNDFKSKFSLKNPVNCNLQGFLRRDGIRTPATVTRRQIIICSITITPLQYF